MPDNQLITCGCGKEVFAGHTKKCVACGKTICQNCTKIGKHCKACFQTYIKTSMMANTVTGFKAKDIAKTIKGD